MAEPTPPQAPADTDAQAGLKAIDNLLSEVDPAFQQKLDQMNSEIAQSGLTAEFESINIGADYLQEDQNDPKAVVVSKPTSAEKPSETRAESEHSLLYFVALFLWEVLVFVGKTLRVTFRALISARKIGFKEALKTWPGEIVSHTAEIVNPLQNIADVLKSYGSASYMRLALIVALLIAMRFIFSDMKKHFSPDSVKDPFLRTWAEVADSSHAISDDESDEDIENPQRHPEYTVLVPRMVANLKALSPKSAPMIAVELYIEASNQDCAIEIHDRSLEVRDALNRVFEESTFTELDTKEGKERLKVQIRGSLNRFLTKGHVKRVFFSSLNVSP